jgi:hypothetical protein
MRTFEDDDPLFAPMLNALFAAFRGTAVMSGCAPSATGANRTISVAEGSVQINGEIIAVSAGSVSLYTGGETDRYDLVSVTDTGGLTVTRGTVERKCPVQPADTCLIAIVFVPAGATVIATGNVYDARLLASQVVAAALMCSGAVTANAVGGASPELTVSSNFVDVPGTTLRKTIPFSVQVYTDDQWNTLLSFTIPANYSSNYDSNCRILIARPTGVIVSHTIAVRALRNGVEIGSGSAPWDNNTVTVNTTGGFRAGDEIVLEGKCAKSESPTYDRYYTLSDCRIQSSRRADLPILAQFVEEVW